MMVDFSLLCKGYKMDLRLFYNAIRDTFTLTDQNVKGFDFVLKAAKVRAVPLHELAYILATVWHETAHTMQPIAEYGKGKGRKYGVKGKYGQVPYGRGYVQLTWDANYEKADKKLGLQGALLKNFDLAMKPDVAVQILFVGMKEGWFTGVSLKDFIDNVDESDQEDLREFSNARKIINGTDKQVMIGQYAIVFEKALKAAGYNTVKAPTPAPVTPTPTPPVQRKATLWDVIVTFFLYIFRKR
jgi:hypothetical protein